MIEKPTALILGAGASKPYGFPTGPGLLKAILDGVRGGSWNPLLGGLPGGQHAAVDFCRVLKASQVGSIDELLGYRPEFGELGRALIAIALMPCENKDADYPTKGHWYQWLRRHLMSGCRNLSDFQEGNKLSIITFNYDRSLEHYMFTCLAETFHEPTDACRAAIDNMLFLHPHGSLGPLPWQDPGSGRSYGKKELSHEGIKSVSRNIRIISDELDESAAFRDAQMKIAGAEQVVFLGFGFHELTMRRLGLVEGQPETGRLRGSAMGMASSDVIVVRKRWGLRLGHPTHDALQYLEEAGI